MHENFTPSRHGAVPSLQGKKKARWNGYRKAGATNDDYHNRADAVHV